VLAFAGWINLKSSSKHHVATQSISEQRFSKQINRVRIGNNVVFHAEVDTDGSTWVNQSSPPTIGTLARLSMGAKEMAPPFLVFRITGQQRLRCAHKIIDEFVKIVLPGGVVYRFKSCCFAEQVTSECGVQWKSELLGNGHGRSVKTNSGSRSRSLASSALGRQAILSTSTIQVYFVRRLSDTHAPQRQVG